MSQIKVFLYSILPLLSADICAYSNQTVLFFDNGNVSSSYEKIEHNKKLVLSVSSEKGLLSLNSGYGIKGFSPVRYSLYVMPGFTTSSSSHSVSMLINSYVYINSVYSLEFEYNINQSVVNQEDDFSLESNYKLGMRADWFGVTFDSVFGVWADESARSSGVYLGIRM